MLKKKAIIIDYGCGNLTSIKRAIEYLNFNALITNDPNNLHGFVREFCKFDTTVEFLL